MVFHFIETVRLTGHLWDPDVLCGESKPIILSQTGRRWKMGAWLLPYFHNAVALKHGSGVTAGVFSSLWKCETATVAAAAVLATRLRRPLQILELLYLTWLVFLASSNWRSE